MPDYTDTYQSESKFIKVDDLQKKRVNLTIKDAVEQTIGEDKKLVLEFKETPKQLVLNITNCRMLEMLTDSKNTDDWIDLKITLRPDVTSYNGKPVGCVRVDSELPPQVSAPPPKDNFPPVTEGRGEPLAADDIPF